MSLQMSQARSPRHAAAREGLQVQHWFVQNRWAKSIDVWVAVGSTARGTVQEDMNAESIGDLQKCQNKLSGFLLPTLATCRLLQKPDCYYCPLNNTRLSVSTFSGRLLHHQCHHHHHLYNQFHRHLRDLIVIIISIMIIITFTVSFIIIIFFITLSLSRSNTHSSSLKLDTLSPTSLIQPQTAQ